MVRELAVALARITPAPLKNFVHGNRLLDGFLRHMFGWLTQVGGAVMTVQSGPMRGIRLRTGEHVSHAHISGTYELKTQAAIHRLLQRGWVCYDVGASIGYLSLLMARTAGEVYAFEPAPHAVKTMTGLLEENQFTHVHIVQNPVSDTRTKVRFGLTDVAYGSGIARSEVPWPTIDLDTVVLNEFVQTHPFPDFIKIDIEGEEGRALQGATRLLEKGSVVICCELHSPALAQEVTTLLQSYGYRMEDLDGNLFIPSAHVTPGEVQVIGLPPNGSRPNELK